MTAVTPQGSETPRPVGAGLQPSHADSPSVRSVNAWTVPYTEPNDHGSRRYVTYALLTDEDGCHGWGEAVTISHEAAAATTAILRAWSPHLAGKPATPAQLAADMESLGWWYGTHGGVSGFAAAALDTAVWDVLGHHVGLPVLTLLGGAHHDNLPVVVTGHATLANLDSQARTFADWVAERQACGVKVGIGKAGDARLGHDHRRDTEFVASLRRALGDDPLIMIDVSPRLSWSVSDAIRRAQSFDAYGLHWLEEPLGARDPEGYRRLRDATSTLIAYGEREWTTAQMAECFATGTLDVLGIDTGRAGVTGFMAGSVLAAANKRQVNAHAFAGPISYAAGLTCSLASARAQLFEVAPMRNSLMTDLGRDIPAPHDGRVGPLQGPGFGVEVDPAQVASVAAGA